jgi:hypothetical protein
MVVSFLRGFTSMQKPPRYKWRCAPVFSDPAVRAAACFCRLLVSCGPAAVFYCNTSRAVCQFFIQALLLFFFAVV